MKKISLMLVIFFMACVNEQMDNESREKEIALDLNLLELNPGFYSTKKSDYHFSLKSSGLNLRGRFYYPYQASLIRKFPMVFIFHGFGMKWDDYDIFQEHLASHGIASVSVAWGLEFTQATKDRIKEHINYLYNQHKIGKIILKDDVALIGHSAGGSVVNSYNYLFKNAGKSIKSIIGLAPNQNLSPKSLFARTKSFLVLYGTSDDDAAVVGNPPHDFFDKARTEYTVNFGGYPEVDMIELNGGFRHSLLNDKGGTSDYAKKRRNIAISYAAGYLKLHLKNQYSFKTYFKFGRPIPGTEQYFFKHQHFESRKTVLANFQGNNSRNINLFGGDIKYNDLFYSNISVRNASNLQNSPHSTRVLHIKWTNKSQPRARFYLPSGKRNISQHTFISFRVAQLYEAPMTVAYNKKDEDQDFYIRLRSKNGKYRSLLASHYGKIPYPVKVWVPHLSAYKSYEGMSTITIPLRNFTNVDLTNVDYVSLRFTHHKHKTGSIVIDNLEFHN